MSEPIKPPVSLSVEDMNKINSQSEQNLKGVSQISRNSNASGTSESAVVNSGYNYDPTEVNSSLAYQKAFDNQDLGTLVHNTFAGMGKQAWAGAVMQFAGNDPRSLANMITENTDSDYENGLTKYALGVLKDAQDKNPIFKNPANGSGIWNKEYLAQQLQGLGLTGGIMLEGLGEQALLTGLTALTGGGASELQGAEVAKTLLNISRANKLRQFAFGAFQGIKEAHMNAIFTGQETREKYVQLGYSEEEARKIGNETATRAFRIETLPLALINGLQWGALGHYSPWGKAEGEFMGASGAFENLASKLKPKMGKTGAWIADKTINAASEAFEEAWQDIPQGWSQYTTDEKYGHLDKDKNGKTKTLSDYLFNEGMRDDAIGGAFGGIMFSLLGGAFTKGMARFGARRFDAQIGKAYNQMLKATTERGIQDMQNLKTAVDSGDENAIRIARSEVNRNQTINALRWDKIKGGEETSMFDSRIDQMNTILKAVESNDVEALKKYKIESQEDKDFILNTYPELVNQSLEIKEDLAKNIANSIDYDSGEKLTELQAVRKSHTSELQRAQKRIAEVQSTPGFQALTPEMKSYALLSSELKSLEGDVNRTEAQKQRRKEIKQQLEALKSDNFDHNNLTEAQQNELKATPELQSLEQVYDAKAVLEHSIEQSTAEVAKFSSVEGQVNAKKEQFQKRLSEVDKITDTKVLDDIQKEAKRLGLYTDTLHNKIESKKADLKAKEKAAKNVTKLNTKAEKAAKVAEAQTNGEQVEQEQTPEEKRAELQKLAEDSRKKKTDTIAQETKKNIPEVPQMQEDEDLLLNLQKAQQGKEKVNIEEEKPDYILPGGRPDDPYAGVVSTEDLFGLGKPVFATDPTYKQRFKERVGKIKEAYTKAGKELSFRDLLNYYISHDGKGAEKAFNYIADAYKENGGEIKENLEDIYQDVFGVEEDKALMQEFANMQEEVEIEKEKVETAYTTPTEEKIVEQNAKADKAVSDEETPYTNEDESDRVNDIDSDQIAEAQPKIPFLGILYTPVYNEFTGKYEFVSKGEDLNRTGKTVLDKILNFKIFNKGTKFHLRVNPNWQEAETQIWERNDKGFLVSKTVPMSQWMKQEGIPMEESERTPEQQEKWIGKVPMDMWLNGENIGPGMHDVEWWNERNTASFTRGNSPGIAKMLQDELIAKGKAEAMRIRKAVLNGNTEMVITKRRDGHATNLAPTEAKRIVSEENPTAQVAYVKKGEVYTLNPNGKGEVKVALNQIVNASTIGTANEGVSHILTQIDVKDGKPMFVLNMVTDNDKNFQSSQDTVGKFEQLTKQLEIVKEHIWILKDNADGKKVDPKKLATAQKLREDLKKITNIDIADFKGNVPTGYDNLRRMFPVESASQVNATIDESKASKNKVKTETKTVNGKPILNLKIQGYGFTKNGFPVIKRNSDGTITVENYKSESGEEGYAAMLKDHFTTQKKFYKITDEKGKPMYIAYAQPILQFDLVKQGEKSQEAQTEETVKEKTSPISETKKEEIKIIDSSNIITNEGTKGAAQYNSKTNTITIDRELLKQKFEEKAWTNPRELSETLGEETVKSKAEVLSENQFSTYEEWEKFVIEHERQHSLYSREDYNKDFPNGNKGGYETEINNRALKALGVEKIQKKEPIVGISHGQRQRVLKYLVNNILNSLGSKEVKYSEVVKELGKSFDKYILPLKETHLEEYNYLVANKDSILGLGKYANTPNTVREKIEDLLGEKIKESDLEKVEAEEDGPTLDEAGQIIKGLDDAGYSYNVKNSLSARMKRLVSGIKREQVKSSLDEFAGLSEYYEADVVFDTLQRLLSDTPNTIEDLLKKIDSKLEHNPKEFEFLKELRNRIENTDEQLQKEFLFKLNQTKNDMFFIMAKDDKNGFSLNVLNANSKEPIRRLQEDFKDNFKLSSLIDKFEDGYTINKEKATQVLNLFNEWVKRNDSRDFSSIPTTEVKDWLANFGIFVSDKTVEDLQNKDLNGGRTWESLFSKNGLLGHLRLSLLASLNNQDKFTDKGLKAPKLEFGKESILEKGNGGYLKDLSTLEVNNNVITGTVMRIAGKNVMPFSQPNFTSEQVRKLKQQNSQLLEEMAEASFTKNSLLVKLLGSNEAFKKIFNVSYIGLQSIKKAGAKNVDNAGVTDLSASDLDVLLQGFMTSQGNVIQKAEENEHGIELVSTKIAFPPLSDSSQMFLMDTVKYNLKAGNFTFNEDGSIKFGDEVLEALYSQLVLPDLQRITDFLRAKREGTLEDFNIEFQEIGSQIFTIIPRLNTLDVDGVELLKLVKESEAHGKVVTDDYEKAESIIDTHTKDLIKQALQEVIMDNVNSKFNSDTEGKISGTWVEEGLVVLDEKTGIGAGPIDAKYLKARGTEDRTRQLKVAALDYVINNMIHQSQVQMLFAGDLNNYTKDKDNFFEKADAMTPEERTNYFVQYMQDNSINLFKRLKEQLSPGNRLADSKNKTYKQIIINDKESSSNNLIQLARLWHPDKLEQNKKALERFKEVENEIDEIKEQVDSQEKTTKLASLNGEYNKLKKELKKALPKIADYFDITTTDGQEFTTWREHLDCLYYEGKLSKKEYEEAGRKLKDQSENGVNESNKLTEEEKHVIFQPMKPLHAGMYFEKHGGYTLQRFVYVKTSSFPLIPEMTQGIKLDAIRKNIEQYEKDSESNVRVVYRSGIKVGATKENVDVEELYNSDYEGLKDKIDKSTITLKRENFSIQQDKPFKTDKNIAKGKEDEINRGTQIDKILLGNGINKITDRVFPNMFDEEILSELGIPNETHLTGEELYNISNHLAIKEQQMFRREIFDDLGIKEENSEWYNSVETLEKIQKLLDTRLSNYQDKYILQLKYKVLENGVFNYYTKDEVNEKGLTPSGAEFDIPIWISPNSQKFESVLNSIVTNKAVKLKFPGSSSPVGSQEGFIQKKGEDEIKDTTGIIYTESYDPNKGLTATYYDEEHKVIKSAQVLLPSKLRRKVTDKNGKVKEELVDMSKLTKVVDGRTVLDFDKVDPEILTMFSFRIPTSSHQSGSVIEVVGFLPHEMGDLMIVPKDHVTQIGEDFDIDVRYYYRQNYFTDESGKLRRFKQSDIPATTNEQRKNLYEKYRDLKNEVKDENRFKIDSIWRSNKEILYTLLFAKMELAEYHKNNVSSTYTEENIEAESDLMNEIKFLEDSLVSKEVVQGRQEELKKQLQNQLESLEKEFTEEEQKVISNYISAKAVDKMKHKVIQNNLIGLYKSIYTSPSDEVQKKINATLSTDFAKTTANLINSTIKGKKVNINFSVFDDRTEKDALRLGSSGKLGIGVHSNWVVFNSLLQQQKEAVRVISDYDSETGEPIYMDMTLGNLNSNGLLGQSKTIDGDRDIATVNMENQNCSTDNQKLQIMGKRNENKFTINAFALMCNLGFDKGKLNDGTEVHIPSMFISQPIIRRYVELKEEYASMFSEFSDDAERDIAERLKQEFGDGVKFFVTEGGNETNFMDKEAYESVSKELSAQALLDNMANANNSQQWAIYQKFIELNKASTNTNKVMQLLNIEKEGLGISFFNTIDKKDALLFDMFSSNVGLENATKLFGEKIVVAKDDEDRIKELVDDGYVHLFTDDSDSYYMKPTTSQNAKLINSLSMGFNLWNKVFPFEDKFITEQLNLIGEASGVRQGSSKELEMKYKVLSSMKDFVYAFNNPKLFTLGVTQERAKLTIDSENNQSLATYLNELKNKKHPLFDQPFFKGLEFDIFTDGKKPSVLKYSVNSNSGLNKNDAYLDLESLIGSDTVLPSFNGQENYTYNDLIRDLTKYAMLSDQENGAIGFRNYIPLSAFKAFGVDANLKRVASTQDNHFNLLLNGELRAILNLSGSSFINEEDMTIEDKVSKRTPKEESYINALIKNVNSRYGDNTIVWDKENHRFIVNSIDKSNFQSLFVEQYFQHNPEEAKKINWKKKESTLKSWNSTKLNNLTKFTIIDSTNARDFLTIKKKEGGYMLFKHIGNGEYERINTLGGFGMNEYSPLRQVSESLYSDNNMQVTPSDTLTINKSVPVQDNVNALKNNSTTYQVINNLLSNSKNDKIKSILKQFVKYGESGIKVISKENLISSQGFQGYYSVSEGAIYIDKTLADNMNSDTFQEVFVEEYLHSLTHKAVSEWVGETGIRIDNGKVIVDINYKKEGPKPYYITKLVDVFKQGTEAIIKDATDKGQSLEDVVARLNALHDTFKGGLNSAKMDLEDTQASKEDIENAYRVFSIDEFIAGVFVTPEFRKILDNTEYKGTGKTILQHFKDAIRMILSKLSNNTVKDSVTEHAIDGVFALLNKVNTVTMTNTEIWKETIEDSEKEAEKLIQEPLQKPISETQTVQTETQEEEQPEVSATKPLESKEISSNAKGLRAALTNPTELAVRKGNLNKSYPITYGNRRYRDVEEAYQDLKSNFTKDNDGPSSTYGLMVGLLKAKFNQYPELREEVAKQGGSEWILASTHQPTKQNSVWETGGKNWFIKALNEAYLATEKKEEKNTLIDNDFQYFGTKYSIQTEDGKAVDVPELKQGASETNIKFAQRKQKVLDAYNENPNVDKQNGKPFRGETQKEVTKEELEEALGRFEYLAFAPIGFIGYDIKGNKYEVVSKKDKYGRSLEYRVNDGKDDFMSKDGLRTLNPKTVSSDDHIRLYKENPLEVKERLIKQKNNIEIQEVKTEEKPMEGDVVVTPKKADAVFTFKDGTQIKTGFELNPQQKEALQAMADFYNDKSKSFFTLEGYAGTGKTTIIKFLVDYINSKRSYNNIVFSSPTHRANSVLKRSLKGQKVITLHKAFGLSPEMDLEEFDATKAVFSKQNKEVLSKGDTLIIDESSMINNELYDFITKAAKEKGIRVVFMGDPAQLSPVKQTGLSKVFDNAENSYELTQVMRTGDNPLLAEVTHIRNTQDTEPMTMKSESNPQGEGVTYQDNNDEFYGNVVDLFTSEEFKENPLLIRVVSGTNANVSAVNQMIRKGIFGENAKNEYNVGEIIMGYDNFDVDYRTGEPKIYNSGDYVVTDISEPIMTSIPGTDKKAIFFKMTIQDAIDKNSKPVTVNMLSKTNPTEVFEALGKTFEQYRREAMAKRKGSPEAAQAWQKLSDFKATFATPVNISYGTYSDGSPAVKIRKTLDYGYAHTIHKSQGGTYKYIAVDSRDISRFKNKATEKQLKYVALSRATTHAYVFTNEKVNNNAERVEKSLGNNDIVPTNTLFKPDFSRLQKEGRLQVQGFFITLNEFNSMTKEEQEHFKKCL